MPSSSESRPISPPTHRQGEPSANAMVLQVVHVGDRTYEHRLNRCGKRNCTICYPPDGSGPVRPGHGPYWYLCLPWRKKWLRIYIGKNLDTARFALPDGSTDWGAIKAYKSDRSRARHNSRPSSTASTASTSSTQE